MDVDPKQVLRIIDYRDIDIRLENGRLIGQSRNGAMPDDMVRFIQHFKRLVIDELTSRESTAA